MNQTVCNLFAITKISPPFQGGVVGTKDFETFTINFPDRGGLRYLSLIVSSIPTPLFE
jgi:hypothetical protein